MGRNQQPKGGGGAGNKGKQSYASGGKGGGNNKKTVGAATALGLGPRAATTEHSALGPPRAGHGTAKSSGLTFWICRDERYRFGRIGWWLEYRPAVWEWWE